MTVGVLETSPGGIAFDPVFGSQATFRVLLDAMARPGTVHRLPVIDASCPRAPLAHVSAILLTLIDHEVTFAVVGHAVDMVDHLARATGSRIVPVREADFILVTGSPTADVLLSAQRGTIDYPDQGATIVMVVESLASGAGDQGRTLRPHGPGTGPESAFSVVGLPPDILPALAEANVDRPLGVDLVLVDASGHVVALPRSADLGREPEEV